MDCNRSEQTQRLDKWLKTVRLFKTRKMAGQACDSRLVKVNGVTSKASKNVKIDDEITIRLRGRYRSFRIAGVSHKSIPAKTARELYVETTEDNLTPEERELIELAKKTTRRERPRYTGRPTKKSRRELMRMKRTSLS